MSTLTATMLFEMPRRRRWTRDLYYRAIDAGLFDEDDKLELIGGEIVEEGMVDRMAPQSPEHGWTIRRATRRLEAAFGTGNEIRYQMPLSLGGDSDPEPDIVVARGSEDDYVHRHPTDAELVVEVAIASAQFDRTVKAGLYASAGIPEYWIVNLDDRVLEVYRDPGTARDEPFEAAYGTKLRLVAGDTIHPLGAPGSEIAVSDLLP
jgi:Uma2 family endonuclease